jgi:hypothetical protein
MGGDVTVPFPHLNELVFICNHGMSDNEISQIARTYGKQVKTIDSN